MSSGAARLRSICLRLSASLASVATLGCALADTVAPDPTYFLRWEGATIRLDPANCGFSSPVVGVTTSFGVGAFASGDAERRLQLTIRRLKSDVSASGFPSGDYGLASTLGFDEVGTLLSFSQYGISTVTHTAQSGNVRVMNEGTRITVSFEGVPMRNALTNVTAPASGRMACE